MSRRERGEEGRDRPESASSPMGSVRGGSAHFGGSFERKGARTPGTVEGLVVGTMGVGTPRAGAHHTSNRYGKRNIQSARTSGVYFLLSYTFVFSHTVNPSRGIVLGMVTLPAKPSLPARSFRSEEVLAGKCHFSRLILSYHYKNRD